MAGYGILGLCVYICLKKNPMESRSMLQHANGLIKYMLIDKEASDMLAPIINDFNSFSPQQQKIFNSGGSNMGGSNPKKQIDR